MSFTKMILELWNAGQWRVDTGYEGSSKYITNGTYWVYLKTGFNFYTSARGFPRFEVAGEFGAWQHLLAIPLLCRIKKKLKIP